jgi:nucleotide-binding universal stress UspA family protein
MEERGFVSHIERLLVATDSSRSGILAFSLVSLLTGVREILTTALKFDAEPVATDETIGDEAKKGYGLMFIGREPASAGNTFTGNITRNAVSFGGPVAIVIARDERPCDQSTPLNILVPVTGTPISRQGAELAIALAQGSHGSVTALHVAGPSSIERPRWGVRLGTVLAPDSSADATIQDVIELGKAYDVEVRGIIRSRRTAENAIIREIRGGNYNLMVMGVSPRPGDQLFFGEVPADLLERSPCSLVFLASEPAAPAYTTAS